MTIEQRVFVLMATRNVPNPVARILCWLMGTAMMTGGFPLTVSLRQIRQGFSTEGKSIAGTNCHHTTVVLALQWLQSNGVIAIDDGEPRLFGKQPVVIRMLDSF